MGNETPEAAPRIWVFGNLLDETAQRELCEFYQALEKSSKSTKMLPRYDPPITE